MAAPLGRNLVGGVAVRTIVQRVKNTVLVVVIVFNGIDAPVTVEVLTGLCNTDKSPRAAVEGVFLVIVVVVIVFGRIKATVAIVVHRGGVLVDPVFLAEQTIVIDIEHAVIIVIVIARFVLASVRVVVVPRKGNPSVDIVRTIVIWYRNTVSIFVSIARITYAVVVEVCLGWVRL